jgi:hypothetical protein
MSISPATLAEAEAEVEVMGGVEAADETADGVATNTGVDEDAAASSCRVGFVEGVTLETAFDDAGVD